MKREIKFRAKDMCGEWHYGDLELPRNEERNPYIHSYKENGEYDKQYPIDDDTIGQFTGLYDKNGEEIYEKCELDGKYIVMYMPPKFVGKDVSNNNIIDLYDNKHTITKEYCELPQNA